jgi:hypothetical protein
MFPTVELQGLFNAEFVGKFLLPACKPHLPCLTQVVYNLPPSNQKLSLDFARSSCSYIIEVHQKNLLKVAYVATNC